MVNTESMDAANDASKTERVTQLNTAPTDAHSSSPVTAPVLCLSFGGQNVSTSEFETSSTPESAGDASVDIATICCSVPLVKLQDISLESKKRVSKKFLCLYCDRTFVTTSLRQKHTDRCHSAKQARRSSSRFQSKTPTVCIYCKKLNNSEHTLSDLFRHLVHKHPNKYFACLECEERFSFKNLLDEHNLETHKFNSRNDRDDPLENDFEDDKFRTRHKARKKEEKEIEEKRSLRLRKELRKRKVAVKSTKSGVKKQPPSTKTRKRKKAENDDNNKEKNCINPYPTFDAYFRVKKITDHSIDNLKISSLTFDDVFDKAFFNRIKCNIQENLQNHIDGKLFNNEESESRISNFEKMQEANNTLSENFGCDITLNAATPVVSLLSSQLGEDLESQIEYGAKASKKKVPVKKDEVHYKYFTRRKYQASILENKENRDLSKLDMWTQLIVKDRQQKIINDQKSDKEKIEYTKGIEYKTKMQNDELNRILDRRGPFEDLKEEANKMAAIEKMNRLGESVSHVSSILDEIFNKVFEKEIKTEVETNGKVTEKSEANGLVVSEIPLYLNLQKTSLEEEDIDRSDKITLICSSQETENFELTQKPRDKNALVELTGEWTRTRIYICAACGVKLPNMKFLLDHKSVYHPNVWVQHYEFVGNQSELYRHLSIPGLGKVGHVEDYPMLKLWRRSDARVCTKCSKTCNSLAELHRHMLECGEDWSWMLARKKLKYRPFGSKSRKKRRGLVKRIIHKETPDGEPRPKRKYNVKPKHDGPRQRPSDAETIQRMLANLPAKRATRKLISMKEGISKPRRKQIDPATVENQHGRAQKKKNAEATQPKTKSKGLKCNPVILRKSVRNINKVLASKVLDNNSTIRVKRKLISALQIRTRSSRTEEMKGESEEDVKGSLLNKVKLIGENVKKRVFKNSDNKKITVHEEEINPKPEDHEEPKKESVCSKIARSLSFKRSKKREQTPHDSNIKKFNDKKKSTLNIFKNKAKKIKLKEKRITKIAQVDGSSQISDEILPFLENFHLEERENDRPNVCIAISQPDVTIEKTIEAQTFEDISANLGQVISSNLPEENYQSNEKNDECTKSKTEQNQQEICTDPNQTEIIEHEFDVEETVGKIDEITPMSPDNVAETESVNQANVKQETAEKPNETVNVDGSDKTVDVVKSPVQQKLSESSIKKLKKKSKGLNDCIAMLTSKLQQKTDFNPTDNSTPNGLENKYNKHFSQETEKCLDLSLNNRSHETTVPNHQTAENVRKPPQNDFPSPNLNIPKHGFHISPIKEPVMKNIFPPLFGMAPKLHQPFLPLIHNILPNLLLSNAYFTDQLRKLQEPIIPITQPIKPVILNVPNLSFNKHVEKQKDNVNDSHLTNKNGNQIILNTPQVDVTKEPLKENQFNSLKTENKCFDETGALNNTIKRVEEINRTTLVESLKTDDTKKTQFFESLQMNKIGENKKEEAQKFEENIFEKINAEPNVLSFKNIILNNIDKFDKHLKGDEVIKKFKEVDVNIEVKNVEKVLELPLKTEKPTVKVETRRRQRRNSRKRFSRRRKENINVMLMGNNDQIKNDKEINPEIESSPEKTKNIEIVLEPIEKLDEVQSLPPEQSLSSKSQEISEIKEISTLIPVENSEGTPTKQAKRRTNSKKRQKSHREESSESKVDDYEHDFLNIDSAIDDIIKCVDRKINSKKRREKLAEAAREEIYNFEEESTRNSASSKSSRKRNQRRNKQNDPLDIGVEFQMFLDAHESDILENKAFLENLSSKKDEEQEKQDPKLNNNETDSEDDVPLALLFKQNKLSEKIEGENRLNPGNTNLVENPAFGDTDKHTDVAIKDTKKSKKRTGKSTDKTTTKNSRNTTEIHSKEQQKEVLDKDRSLTPVGRRKKSSRRSKRSLEQSDDNLESVLGADQEQKLNEFQQDPTNINRNLSERLEKEKITSPKENIPARETIPTQNKLTGERIIDKEEVTFNKDSTLKYMGITPNKDEKRLCNEQMLQNKELITKKDITLNQEEPFLIEKVNSNREDSLNEVLDVNQIEINQNYHSTNVGIEEITTGVKENSIALTTEGVITRNEEISLNRDKINLGANETSLYENETVLIRYTISLSKDIITSNTTDHSLIDEIIEDAQNINSTQDAALDKEVISLCKVKSKDLDEHEQDLDVAEEEEKLPNDETFLNNTEEVLNGKEIDSSGLIIEEKNVCEKENQPLEDTDLNNEKRSPCRIEHLTTQQISQSKEGVRLNDENISLNKEELIVSVDVNLNHNKKEISRSKKDRSKSGNRSEAGLNKVDVTLNKSERSLDEMEAVSHFNELSQQAKVNTKETVNGITSTQNEEKTSEYRTETNRTTTKSNIAIEDIISSKEYTILNDQQKTPKRRRKRRNKIQSEETSLDNSPEEALNIFTEKINVNVEDIFLIDGKFSSKMKKNEAMVEENPVMEPDVLQSKPILDTNIEDVSDTLLQATYQHVSQNTIEESLIMEPDLLAHKPILEHGTSEETFEMDKTYSIPIDKRENKNVLHTSMLENNEASSNDPNEIMEKELIEETKGLDEDIIQNSPICDVEIEHQTVRSRQRQNKKRKKKRKQRTIEEPSREEPEPFFQQTADRNFEHITPQEKPPQNKERNDSVIAEILQHPAQNGDDTSQIPKHEIEKILEIPEKPNIIIKLPKIRKNKKNICEENIENVPQIQQKSQKKRKGKTKSEVYAEKNEFGNSKNGEKLSASTKDPYEFEETQFNNIAIQEVFKPSNVPEVSRSKDKEEENFESLTKALEEAIIQTDKIINLPKDLSEPCKEDVEKSKLKSPERKRKINEEKKRSKKKDGRKPKGMSLFTDNEDSSEELGRKARKLKISCQIFQKSNKFVSSMDKARLEEESSDSSQYERTIIRPNPFHIPIIKEEVPDNDIADSNQENPPENVENTMGNTPMELGPSFQSSLMDNNPIFHEVPNIYAEVTDRFGIVQKSFESVHNSFDETPEEFEGIPKGFQNIRKEFENMPNRYDDIASNFEGLQNRNDVVPNTFKEISSSLVRNTKNLEKLPTCFQTNPQDLQEIPNPLKDIPRTFEDIENTFGNIPKTLQDISNVIENIPDAIEEIAKISTEITKMPTETQNITQEALELTEESIETHDKVDSPHIYEDHIEKEVESAMEMSIEDLENEIRRRIQLSNMLLQIQATEKVVVEENVQNDSPSDDEIDKFYKNMRNVVNRIDTDLKNDIIHDPEEEENQEDEEENIENSIIIENPCTTEKEITSDDKEIEKIMEKADNHHTVEQDVIPYNEDMLTVEIMENLPHKVEIKKSEGRKSRKSSRKKFEKNTVRDFEEKTYSFEDSDSKEDYEEQFISYGEFQIDTESTNGINKLKICRKKISDPTPILTEEIYQEKKKSKRGHKKSHNSKKRRNRSENLKDTFTVHNEEMGKDNGLKRNNIEEDQLSKSADDLNLISNELDQNNSVLDAEDNNAPNYESLENIEVLCIDKDVHLSENISVIIETDLQAGNEEVISIKDVEKDVEETIVNLDNQLPLEVLSKDYDDVPKDMEEDMEIEECPANGSIIESKISIPEGPVLIFDNFYAHESKSAELQKSDSNYPVGLLADDSNKEEQLEIATFHEVIDSQIQTDSGKDQIEESYEQINNESFEQVNNDNPLKCNNLDENVMEKELSLDETDKDEKLDSSVNQNEVFDNFEVPVKTTKFRGKKGKGRKGVRNKREKLPGIENLDEVYCDICNRSFTRMENLVKHKKTLTHIAKLSEIEAREAEIKAKMLEKQKQEELQKADIGINDILTSERSTSVNNSNTTINSNNKSDESLSFSLKPSNNTLNLVDIINDVLDKPIEKEKNYNDNYISSSAANLETKRYKSLGERKSFESDINATTYPFSAIPITNEISSKIPNASVLKQQLTILENIIERGYIDDITESSNKSSISENKSENYFMKPTSENFVKPPTHYEEISNDSLSVRNQFEEQSLRKVLNRDEALFLECCSLLKSSSEVSDFSKKSSKQILQDTFNMKQSDEPEWLESKSLKSQGFQSNGFENSCPNTPLGDGFGDEYSNTNSNTIATDWSTKQREKESENNQFEDNYHDSIHKEERNFSQIIADKKLDEELSYGSDNEECTASDTEVNLEEDELAEKNVSKFGKFISKTWKNSLQTLRKNNSKLKKKQPPEITQTSITDYAVPLTSKSEELDNKKVMTKGAMKVFEGLKVSIPTDDLDLKELLNGSYTAKRDDEKVKEVSVESLTVEEQSKKLVESKKNIMKTFGNSLGMKITKKKHMNKTKDDSAVKEKAEDEKKGHDVYDFEETQDNMDLFGTKLATIKEFRTKEKEKKMIEAVAEKDGENVDESDSESQGWLDNFGFDAQSVSSYSSESSNLSIKQTAEQSITKKKCMIMGRIFKNAFKANNVKDLPSIDNAKFVEDYVNHLPEQKQEKRKLSQEEMDDLFNKLLDDSKDLSKMEMCEKDEKEPREDIEKRNVQKIDRKLEIKKSNNKSVTKRKRQRNNSGSTDDEFSLNKSKRTSKKKSKNVDNSINLEQELRECIGVASRKSQRTCTSGKQNVLVEYWSSDDSNFEAFIRETMSLESKPVKSKSPEPQEPCVTPSTTSSTTAPFLENKKIKLHETESAAIIKRTNKVATTPKSKTVDNNNKLKQPGRRKSTTKATCKVKKIEDDPEDKKLKKVKVTGETLAANRRKRPAADTLYYWSSSSEDESRDFIETKPIRDEIDDDDDDDDIPVQHGWIVGESTKKLVTMLAQAKGKKTEADCVKEQGRKRTTV